MFLHLCVCSASRGVCLQGKSTSGVGGGCLSSGGCASSRVCLQGRSACGGLPTGGSTSSIKAGLHWWGGGWGCWTDPTAGNKVDGTHPTGMLSC